MRRNVTVLFLIALLTLSFTEIQAQDYAKWPNSPGDPTTLAPTISGNVQASPVSLSGMVVANTSFSTGSNSSSSRSLMGFMASLNSSVTAWGTVSNSALYEEYVIAPQSGYNLNLSGMELYLGGSSSTAVMKVQIAYSFTKNGTYTTFASNSATNATNENNALVISSATAMTGGSSTWGTRVNWWSSSFNSAVVSVSNGGSMFLRVYPFVSTNNCTSASTLQFAVANLKISGTASADPNAATLDTTRALTGITASQAVGGGHISAKGGSNITASGLCWNTTGSPTIGDSKTVDNTTITGPVSFWATMTGLSAGQTYYVRAYATNSTGTSYGPQVTVLTLASVTTTSVTSITATTASSGGTLTSTAAFTQKGVCWSTGATPTVSDSHTSDGSSGTGAYTSSITGLTPGQGYYVRAYVTNATGTNYGSAISFTALAPTATLGSNNPSWPAGNIVVGASKQALYRFTLAETNSAATISGVSFTTTNSGSGDIAKYQLWYGTADNLAAASQLGSDITTSLNSGSHSFSSLSQSIASGATGYFWITADISGGATMGNTVYVSALTTGNLTSSTANAVFAGSAFDGGTQTFTATPAIALDGISTVSAGNMAQASTNNIVYNFKLAVTVAGATVNQVDIPNSSTYTSGELTALKLWFSKSNNFAGATAIKTIATPAVSGTQSFTGLSSVIDKDSTGYFWVTADVAGSAVVGHTFQVTPAIAQSNLTFSASVNFSTGTINAGGVQTVSAGTSIVALNGISTIGAQTLGTGSSNNVIYNFKLGVTSVAGTLSQVDVPNIGTYASGDLANLKLLYSATNSIGGAATIGTITSPGNAATQSFTGLSQAIAIGATGYFWITADINSGAVSGNTITISALAGSNITFAGSATVTAGTINASGLQTILPASNTTDYFRTVFAGSPTSGNWSSTATWESSADSVSWNPATLVPDTAAHNINIRNNFTVTVDVNTLADDINIESGAQVTIASGKTLTVGNGPDAPDLIVNGTLKNSGTLTMTGTGTVNGTYEHNIDNGTVPTLTWGTGSTVYITGLVNSTSGAALNLTGIGTCYNVTYNCTSQASNATGYTVLGGGTISILGNLTIQSTGASNLLIAAGGTTNVPVSGNYSQTGGTVWLSRNASGTRGLTVTGNFAVSGGTFDIAQPSATNTYTLSVGGNVTISSSATFTATTAGASNILAFTGSGTQTMTSTGATATTTSMTLLVNKSSGSVVLSNNYTFKTLQLTAGNIDNSGSTLTIASGAAVTRNTGTLQSAPTWSGNPSVTYQNTGTITAGNELPSTVTTLAVTGTGGSVSLSAPVTVSTLALTAGNVNLNGNALHLANASTITRVAGTLTGTPTRDGSVTSITYSNTSDITTGSELPDTVGTFSTASGTGTAKVTTAANVVVTNSTISGSMLDIGTGYTYTALGQTTVSSKIYIDGTMNNTFNTIISGATATTFIVNGLYQHNVTSAGLPLGTWNTGSTCEINGAISGTSLTNSNQTFYNLKFNGAYTGTMNFSTNYPTVNGTLYVVNTGAVGVRMLSRSSGGTLNLGLSGAGGLNVSGGKIEFFGGGTSGTSTATININGDFVQSGGTVSCGNENGTGAHEIINFYGNFNMSGGWFTDSTTYNLALNFAKSGTQTFTKTAGGINCNASVVASGMRWTVNSGSTLDLSSNILAVVGTGAAYSQFAVNSGAGLIVGNSGGLNSAGTSGNIQMGGTKTFNAGANYTYNGSGVTGNALPAAITGGLTINGTVVTLSQSTSTTSLTMTSGNIDLGGNTLTVGTSAGAPGTFSYISGLITGAGSFKRWFGTSAITLPSAAGLFPMGAGSNNRSFWFGGTPSSGGSVTLQFNNAGTTSSVSISDNSSTYINRNDANWVVTPGDGFAGSSFDIQAQASGLAISSVADLDITGASSALSGSFVTPSGTTTDPILQRTGVSSLSGTYYISSLGGSGFIGSEPTAQASAVVLSGATSSSVTVGWTNGNGSNHLVVARLSSVSATAPGDLSDYTANAAFGSGSQIGTGNYVVYNGTSNSVTVTGLTKGSYYYFTVYEFNSPNAGVNYLTTGAPYNYLMAAGTLTAVAGTNIWHAAASWSPAQVPTSSDNVIIPSGSTVQDTVGGSSSTACANLQIDAGGSLIGAQGGSNYVPSNIGSSNSKTVRVFGTKVVNNGTLGTGTDGMRIDVYNSSTPIQFSGTGSTKLTKLYTAVNVPEIKISQSMNLTYQASGTGGGSALTTNNASGQVAQVFTLDANDTLNFGSYAGFETGGGASVDATENWTANISGTILIGPGTGLYIRGGSGKTNSFNILSGGTVIDSANFFPTQVSGTASTAITVASGGVLRVGSAANTTDLTSVNVTGGGTFELIGGTINIGAASGLNQSTGAVQTGTRTFASGATYKYVGSTSQSTGSDLPSTVTGLTIANSNGVGLSQSTSVGTLTLTSGAFTVGANTLTLNNPIAGTAANLSAGSTSSLVIAGSATGINIPAAVSSLNNLTLNNSNGSTLQGALTINGTLTLTSGTLTTTGQTLTLSSGASVIYNGGSITPSLNPPAVVTNYTPAAGATVSSNTEVDGTLSMTNGSVTVAPGNTITLGTSANLTGETTGKYVIGAIQTTRAISGSSGIDAGGLGVLINPNSNNLGATTFVKRIAGDSGMVTSNANTSIKRKWTITPSQQPDSAVTVTLSWVSDNDNGKDLTKLHVWKSDDTGKTWIDFAGPFDASSSRSVTFNTSSFSDFTISDEASPLPVELTSFTSKTSGRNIQLAWETATEVNSSKFVIERSKNNAWVKVGETPAAGKSNAPKSYSFVDKNLNTGKYSYRLKMIDNDGTFKYSSATESSIGLPTEFNLSQNYPNPFNPSTTINYDLPTDAQIRIELYSITGAEIATLMNDVQKAGYNNFVLNMNSYNLPSGTYFYRLTGSDISTGRKFTSVKKMVLLK